MYIFEDPKSELISSQILSKGWGPPNYAFSPGAASEKIMEYSGIRIHFLNLENHT
uniref:Uncharacterized protein n=1 Tax=Candidatus Kentrum sp. LFY TaxID=2126342 RepID=A0A450WYU4_9GAMM|nr:MAG: hypothetical protein BECKLFY1418C_GA0070996_11121 [Candidatus Kentron sp. LFY]